MSNPFENFFRELLQGGGAGAGGDGEGGGGTPQVVNFASAAPRFMPIPGMTVTMSTMPHTAAAAAAGGGGAGVRGRGRSSADAGAGRGRGSLGSVYSGDMPPMAWIQREQQRTPLRFTATNGTANFDGGRLRDEGNQAFKAGKYQEAIEYYTRAIAAEPTVEINYTNRSFAYFKLGKLEESAKDASEAIRLAPGFFKGHYRLGLAQFGQGDYRGAFKSLHRAQELAPPERKDELTVAIAKCESKLARTPATPLITDTDSSYAPSSFGTPICATHPICVPPADLERLQSMVGNAAKVRDRVAKYSSDYAGQKSLVEHKTRSQKIRELMSVATSGRLSELTKEAEEKQESLRRTLKGHDRDAYTDAKRARDAAYQKAWTVAGQIQEAIDKLRAISAEEPILSQRDGKKPEGEEEEEEEKGENGTATPRQGDDGSTEKPPTASTAEAATQEEGDASPPTTSALPSSSSPSPTEGPTDDELTRLMERREEISKEVNKAKSTFVATDTAALAFLKALEEEQEATAKILPLLDEAQTLNAELDRHARHLAQMTTREITDSRLEDLNQVDAAAKRVRSDEASFKKTLAEGDALLNEEAKLEKERLLYERQRIQLQAEVEWYKVQDEPEGKIAALQNHVKGLQDRLAATNQKQKQVQKRILELVETDHPELAWKSMASGSRILRLVKGSGLWLNLSLSDFQVVSTLSSTANSKVYRATRRGENVALKEIPVNDELARRRFQREVSIVASCAHPNVVKIKGVFFDGPFAYILLPYFHRGSVKTMLQKKEKMSWLVVQDMLRQLASGLAYLHERGIVHGDIKPSNILISDDNRPVITDFGIAKDTGRFGEGLDITMTVTTMNSTVEGTTNYMAPEQLLGEARRSTFKSDIWALGVTFYEVAANNAYFHDESLGEPQNPLAGAGAAPSSTGGRLEIPAKHVGGDEKLADLVSSMLTVDVNNRATAYEVLAHPYFSSSLTPLASNQASNALVKSDERIDAVRSYIHAVRAARPQKILVSVSRNQMVDSLSSIIPQLSDEEMLEPIMVVFQGEAGIDEGALTSEMLNIFYVQMVRDKKALVSAVDEGDAAMPSDGGAPPTFMLGTAYLPAEDEKNIPTELFELLGKVLLKSVVENRPLPLKLSSAVLKYFCGVPASILDLEEYDRSLAESLKRMRLLSAEDLEAADLTFSRFSTSFLSNHLDGKYIRDTVVTTENVREYVEMTVQYELIEKRRRALEGVRKGFYSVESIEPHLKLLSPSDLLLLLCGVQHVPSQTIVDALEFQGFPSSSKTPQYLKEILMGMSQNNLRRFLELCTSTAAIPATDAMRKIKVLRAGDTARLPVGHGCVFQLDLPDYDNKQVLQEKLEVALAHVSDGFHIV